MSGVVNSRQWLDHLSQFYELLTEIERQCGGFRRLSECSGRMIWPSRGVYFFFQEGEHRIDSGSGPRVVRVGTHALKIGARSSLWGRLSQHKGTESNGGGNHRGSIFRLLVGRALVERDGYSCPTWGKGSSAPKQVRQAEQDLERAVSTEIRNMPFIWLEIDDEPGPESLRGYVERNVIALLSNYRRENLDSPSASWLGAYCDRERVRLSGLWNQNHVDEKYTAEFLATLGRLAKSGGGV